MSYQVELKRSARKALDNIPPYERDRTRQGIRDLSLNPRSAVCRKLSGRDGGRIRPPNDRVLYGIDDASNKVRVVLIGPWRNIYR